MSETNYKEIVNELKKSVKVIDTNNDKKNEIKEKMMPDIIIFKKESKKNKKELKELQLTIKIKDKELKDKINKDGKEDYEKLLDINLELSKLELRKDKDINKFRKIKKNHYEKIQPFITDNRKLTKEINNTKDNILNEIRLV